MLMLEFLIVLLLMKKMSSFIIEFPRQTRPTKPPSNGKFKVSSLSFVAIRHLYSHPRLVENAKSALV